ncbi:MAG: cation-translocating P-type ATPase [Planctomycetes bacterium]|nr:cation-translocating P-type ATPase [Planctomycetota bacterium]
MAASDIKTKQHSVAHALPIGQLITELDTDTARGLADSQAVSRLEDGGSNELAEQPPVPAWKKFLAQFRELVIWILIVAAIISGALGEWADSLAILAIVLLNGILGFLQEARAEQALSALRNLSAPMARVLRGGNWQALPARELVLGDVIELESGDNIPADVRLVEAFGLTIQEASLTGESVPVEKSANEVCSVDTSLADRANMGYMGTVVAAGKADAVVVATGMQTELGRIAGLLNRYEPEPTPLQRRLEELGRILIVLCLVLVALIFTLRMMRGGELDEVFMLSVSLAVAAVPEGLPAVVTIALALGLQRMVKRNALVRKLPSVETLGSVTVICSDKTGTLTRNEMTVREIALADAYYVVTGTGYQPTGGFVETSFDGKPRAMVSAADSKAAACGLPLNELPHDLIQTLKIGGRCNNARLVPDGDKRGEWKIIGDPTEGALLVMARKAGVPLDTGNVLYELPFDSERKAMSVVIEQDGQRWMYTKGAPEVILAKSTSELCNGDVIPLDKIRREEIANANRAMASRALRVLALSFRQLSSDGSGEFDEDQLTFVGLVGMIDPPRDEVKVAVQRCKGAGIQPVMITGDHPDTALAIARELHIAGDADLAVSGRQLDALSDEELSSKVTSISVYARVSAEHKMRVVQAWKQRNQIVAMTGDGVNDAPAVKAADIGIAMGVTGTDVTKEASDMVLTDDNFTSIVNAVEEGRGIFDNIQKFIHFLLSCNTGEVLLMLFAALIGWPAPLMAIQLLWINLVTDGLPALALAMEPPERDVMQRQPRPPHEPVITWSRGILMLTHGTLIAAAAASGFWYVFQGSDANLPAARTTAFCITAFAQLFYSVSCRSFHYTMPELGLFTNPHLIGAIAISGLLQLSVVTLPFARPIFEVATSLGKTWLLIVALALAPVTVIEGAKIVMKLFERATSPTT